MNPTPEQVKAFRLAEGMTQAQAAEFCYVCKGAWQHWEYAARKMPQATWEFLLMKAERLSNVDAC